MSSAAALIELGERYAALGLPAAARGAFSRALAISADDDGTAARRLAELCLAAGQGDRARDHAREVVKREPGANARVLLGRTQLAAGELSAARMSFSAALAAVSGGPLDRAQAHLGLAAAASAQRDQSGAAANVMAAIDAFCEFAGAEGRQPDEIEAELTLAETLFTRAAQLDRASDTAERLSELAERRPDAPVPLLSSVLLAARQRHGDEVNDAEIEQTLTRELEARPKSRAARLHLIEHRLRKYRDADARAGAIDGLEELVAEITGAGADTGESARSLADSIDLARVYFLLASTYEDDAATVDRAEECYRKGLALRPGHAAAANRLALLTLARGDSEAALIEIERALRIDSGHGLAWRNAARVLDASSPGPGLPGLVERLLDAAIPGAGTAAGGVAPQLVTATAEVARGDVLAGMYTRGHRLKNILGIIGSRTRSARKLAQRQSQDASDSGDSGQSGKALLGERLSDLEREVTDLYEEWATYLRAMQGSEQGVKPVVQAVPTEALIQEVVDAALAGSAVPIQLTIHGPVPDLRGDRLLLREALLNIVSNAAEASSQPDDRGDDSNGDDSSGGRSETQPGTTVGSCVSVSVRTIASSGTPIIEIEVADDGPGIPRADLARVFVPGFTTKETGSGVGLSVAERAITGHHGRIVVDSEVGRGTRFIIILPTDLGGFATLAALPGPADPDLD